MNTCNNCQKENDSHSKFCIFCGSPVDSVSIDQSDSSDTIASEDIVSVDNLENLTHQLSSMNKKFVQLENRILRLEKTLSGKP
ncbi:MAG: hypothetical protein CL707_04900, partial [Chloroflexi bacterium]|nr:hypothetical protein [Chloroflexota bacterium]